MHQDWNIASDHEARAVTVWLFREYVEVVVVVAWDRQVPHPAVVLLRDDPADHGHGRAVGGLEMLIFR